MISASIGSNELETSSETWVETLAADPRLNQPVALVQRSMSREV